MLDDSNAEVQTESTNCIPALIAIVQQAHVTKIVQSLVNNLLKGSERQRDIAAIGEDFILVYCHLLLCSCRPSTPKSHSISLSQALESVHLFDTCFCIELCERLHGTTGLNNINLPHSLFECLVW